MRLRASLTIQRPINEVFAALTDSSSFPTWLTGLATAGTGSPEPGEWDDHLSRDDAAAHGGWASWELIAYEPPGLLALRTVNGPIRAAARWTLEVVAQATRLQVEADLATDGVCQPVPAHLAEAGTEHLRHDLEALQRLLEPRHPQLERTPASE